MDRDQLCTIIAEVLDKIGLYSPQAVELLAGTAAVESDLGTYWFQKGGPALGIFQMEPNTMHDIWDNYLAYRDTLREVVISVTGVSVPSPFLLKTNLAFQVAMARIQYLRVKEALPGVTDINGQAEYWKVYYNTHKGKGTIKKFVEKYQKYVYS